MKPRDLVEFGRWKVSGAAALAALTGAAAFSGRYLLHPPVLLPVAGTLLLAMGASALNQIQERKVDARMDRTAGRPVAAGRVGPGLALGTALLLLAAGETILVAAGPVPALLGLAACAWYNGVYTPLKRVTGWAAFPGALVGAIPPAIGWTAAGGALADPRLGALALVFLLWQVPHFWLLHVRFGPELEGAGLPSLTRGLSPRQIDRIAVAWVVAAGASPALLPLLGFGSRTTPLVYPALGWGLIGLATWQLLGVASRERAHRLAFASVNGYFLLLMLVTAADRLAALV